ncbi:hypothetical protein CO180_00615 [candidate division WWE3 bacterium CG_4_9_14_3_um_filter_41_6]|nr:MAG: hypothetical protein CO180_00615 [candidate division WWE3 bacterium CG_4_9_14_3_um_filter_41_6]
MMFAFLVAIGGVELFVLPPALAPILAAMILAANFALYPIWAWVHLLVWNRRLERRYEKETV